MAASVLPLFAILMALMTGLESRLILTSNPEHYDELIHHQLNVSCQVQGLPTQTVAHIELIKEGKGILFFITDTVLNNGPGSKDNMKADGGIGNHAGNACLNVTIDHPNPSDAGMYKCVVFLYDERIVWFEETGVSNITFIGHDVKDKISSLVTIVREQNKQLDELKAVASVQNQQIDEINKDIKKKQQRVDTLMDCNKQTNETNGENLDKGDCLDKGWTFYTSDLTCLKVFGKDDQSKWLPWSEAREECKKLGGDLVQIFDDNKNNFVFKMIAGAARWTSIGFRNHLKVGFDFKYVDGSPVGSYRPWYEGQPNGDYDGDDKCGCMNSDESKTGQWGDCYLARKRPYVCSISSRLVL